MWGVSRSRQKTPIKLANLAKEKRLLALLVFLLLILHVAERIN